MARSRRASTACVRHGHRCALSAAVPSESTNITHAATFIGDIAVPLALVLLGASFARLRIPRPLRRLPLGAMFAVAFAKMVLSPIVGVFVVQAMVRNGMIDREAKAERFAAVFLSGTPAAVKFVRLDRMLNAS
jgi:predicted permease